MNLNRPHLLLVEDEAGLVETLTDRLERQGFDVTVAVDGHAGERLARQHRFDIILLDVMLPGQSGYDVCAHLRRSDPRTPILMLTARGAVEDRVHGLKLGADDYLQKPFEMSELLARVDALLRRAPAANRQLEIGKARVDFDAGTVTVEGRAVELSARSLQLLKYLVEHKGRAVTREQLLNDVWGHKATPSTRTVDVHVAWLRRALEEDPRKPRHIVTVHAIGYRFDA